MAATDAWCAALAAGLAVTAAAGPVRQPAAGRPSVLLVTVDTLRPDALGWIGERSVTPHADRLAREGVAFPAAVTPAPLTLPAHASLLTGRLPRHHGVRDNGQMLSGTAVTLAERLGTAGYRTAAFVSGFPLQRMFGLDQGFEHYDDRLTEGQEGWLERRANATTDAALAWLANVRQPFFLWVHYYDPHDPYAPPRAFWRSGSRGAYDGEVAFVDFELGRLIEGTVGRAGLLTVFTADHGEALGEHDEATHGYFVYDSTVLVPLVFHWPGHLAPARRREPARLIDVAPTVLDLLGLTPLDSDGVTLGPLLAGRTQPMNAAYLEARLPFTYFGWAPLHAIRTTEYKLIEAPRPELYALHQDPGETRSLDARRHPEARRLRGVLNEVESRPAAASDAVAAPEVLERLRALGYVGGGSPHPAHPSMDLPDPKDRVALRNRLSAAEALLRAGRLNDALAAYDGVLMEEPRNRAATLRAGVALLRLGRTPQAVERLRQAVELDPERAEARYALGDALMRAARPRDAAEQWRELTRLQPRRAEGWFNLGLTLLETDRAAQAVTALARARELAPEESRILVALGRAERRAGRHGESVAHLLQAARAVSNGPFEGAGALGLALQRRGRAAEALPWLEQARPNEAEYPEARFELARLLVAAGRVEAARRALGEALATRAELRERAAADSALAPLLHRAPR